MPRLVAEFQCAANGDGTYRAAIIVEDEPIDRRWCLAAATAEDLQGLYLDFVIARMACPTVHEQCTCLPAGFLATLNQFGLWGEPPDDGDVLPRQ